MSLEQEGQKLRGGESSCKLTRKKMNEEDGQ